jgi:arylsulfatase A-like enzyme
MDSLLALSGVEEEILLERTPCFIWSPGLEPQKVDKVLNTSDLMPTVLNLLGVDSPYDYIGQDAFSESYEGFVPFSNGSWISGDTAYDSGKRKLISVSGNQQTVTGAFQKEMADRVQDFIQINNLILDADYYQE